MHQTEETLWKTSPVASGVKLNERSTVRTSHQQSGGGRVPVGGVRGCGSRLVEESVGQRPEKSAVYA